MPKLELTRKFAKLTTHTILPLELFSQVALMVSVLVSLTSSLGSSALSFLGLGGLLPIVACTGRLHPKGGPFSGFRYITG